MTCCGRGQRALQETWGQGKGFFVEGCMPWCCFCCNACAVLLSVLQLQLLPLCGLWRRRHILPQTVILLQEFLSYCAAVPAAVCHRLAIVPMSQEARGLDAGKRLAEKLVGAGDARSAAIVAVIATEERAHVAVGEGPGDALV